MIEKKNFHILWIDKNDKINFFSITGPVSILNIKRIQLGPYPFIVSGLYRR